MYAKGTKLFQSANKIPVLLLFVFTPVAILISNQFQHVMSQMKENKFMIKFIIYYILVEVIPREL